MAHYRRVLDRVVLAVAGFMVLAAPGATGGGAGRPVPGAAGRQGSGDTIVPGSGEGAPMDPMMIGIGVLIVAVVIGGYLFIRKRAEA